MARELSKEACERKKSKFKGYVIARMLIDDDNVTKPFTYYPRKKCGVPPYFYKTKSQAVKAFNKFKSKNQFPVAHGSTDKVVKFQKRMYLDRY